MQRKAEKESPPTGPDWRETGEFHSQCVIFFSLSLIFFASNFTFYSFLTSLLRLLSLCHCHLCHCHREIYCTVDSDGHLNRHTWYLKNKHLEVFSRALSFKAKISICDFFHLLNIFACNYLTFLRDGVTKVYICMKWFSLLSNGCLKASFNKQF